MKYRNRHSVIMIAIKKNKICYFMASVIRSASNNRRLREHESMARGRGAVREGNSYSGIVSTGMNIKL